MAHSSCCDWIDTMFTPNFTYTHKIVKNLVDIASAREIILNAYLVPKWEISLRRDALIRAAHDILLSMAEPQGH